MLWLIIGGVLAVILVAAYFTDRKSKRIRGHAGRIGNTRSDMYFSDAGYSAHVHHTHHSHHHGSTDFGGGHHG
jgi:ABC-type nickel/cobalt efflux system permease component RcnA